jgi:hypothetical protein
MADGRPRTSMHALVSPGCTRIVPMATGYGFEGLGGGSSELASEIEGRVRTGEVFMSAAASVDRALEREANGGWVTWYSAFMATPLELAYNPGGKFGAELRRGSRRRSCAVPVARSARGRRTHLKTISTRIASTIAADA